MVAIPEKKLKVEQAIEGRFIANDIRKYLGISTLGHPCARYIWYQFRWFLPPEQLTARKKRLFNRGHLEEAIILADLKEIGVKVLTTQKRTISCHGHIQGHLDAILANIPDAPKTDHLGEFKTAATKYFNQLKNARSVQKIFPAYYIQCQGYMHKFKLKRCLFICVCKETDERYYERIKYDKQFALGIFEKGEAIVLAEQPPDKISTDPSYYRCGPKWCQYREICHYPGQYSKDIHKTCRSCRYIEVHDKGRWYCKLHMKFRKTKAQLKGCKKWTLLK